MVAMQASHLNSTAPINFNGAIYIGQCEAGRPHGHGIVTYADGRVYDGAWQAGKRQGQGTFTWPNGDKYVGSWHDGQRQGRMIHSADGSVYVSV